MKAVILAGGLGTRISEETNILPKPMIEIGNKPIIWHIMKIYSHYGINEFVICCGYKGFKIKEYFSNYSLHMSDVTFNLAQNSIKIHRQYTEPWSVTLVDTGEKTLTGGRLKRIQEYVKDETFLFTYGDGLSNININNLIAHHKKSNCLATLTAVQPPGRYGFIEFDQGKKITKIIEKPYGDGGWINGGFFVLEPDIFKFIESDQTTWEKEPLENLSKIGQLNAYTHDDFWHPMDTLRDKNKLEDMWKADKAPWKMW